MVYSLRDRTRLYIILMMAALEVTLEISGAGKISQARAEEVVLGGPSCNVVSGQAQEKKCKISDDLPKQASVVTDLFSVIPALVQLEHFRIQNENFRGRLETARKLSEQQRISSGVLSTPAYLRDMAAYKKGMKLYQIRSDTYQKRLARLRKKPLKNLAVIKKNRDSKRGKARHRLVRQEENREFPYFPGAE